MKEAERVPCLFNVRMNRAQRAVGIARIVGSKST